MLNFQVLFILTAGNTDINKLKLNDLLQMKKKEREKKKAEKCKMFLSNVND